MTLWAIGPYNFGFQLLDMLFTKDELSKSLLYKTPRSTKSRESPENPIFSRKAIL